MRSTKQPESLREADIREILDRYDVEHCQNDIVRELLALSGHSAPEPEELQVLNEKLRVALEERFRGPEHGVNFGDYETMAEWVDQVREEVFGPFPKSAAHLSEEYAKEKAALAGEGKP